MTHSRAAALALFVGFICALLFFALAARHIEAQGLYQDEVLQAAGSFAYLGAPPVGALCARGVPVLNNSYLGAIKTGLYGLYMRLSGRGFTVLSWRRFGIGAVALGMLLFPLLCYRTLGPFFALLALVLLATDGTAILTTRHDWGPTALALFLRLLLIAALARDERDARRATWNNAIAGLLLGVAVFEKLSSAALLGVVVLAVALEPLRRRPRALAALALGAALGGAPLIVVNAFSLLHGKTLVSFADTDPQSRPTAAAFVRDFPGNFVSLGAGVYVRGWILGDGGGAADGERETALMSALLLLTLSIAAWKFRARVEFRKAMLFGLAVFAIPAALYLLPRRTGLHHHVQVIPFAYVGASAALAGLVRLKTRQLAEWAAAGALALTVALLVANHAVAVRRLERDLGEGQASPAWDRAFTRLGEFGAARRDEAAFVLTDWGVSTAIRCLAQGRVNTHEVFWEYGGPQDLERIAHESGRGIIYLVTPTRTGIDPARAARINRDAGLLADWKELPPDPAAEALKPLIEARKFAVAAH